MIKCAPMDPMDHLSKLITKAQKGDQDAFGQIYNLFYNRIFRYCKFNSKNTSIAQDICQETFLKAWKSLPTFSQKGGSFQAYLFRIARNLIIDLSRKKKEESLENYKETLEIKESIEEKIDNEESINKIKLALKELTHDERQIIILRYFEDLTKLEVAKVMGIREGNLRVKTYRALKKLKLILK